MDTFIGVSDIDGYEYWDHPYNMDVKPNQTKNEYKMSPVAFKLIYIGFVLFPAKLVTFF